MNTSSLSIPAQASLVNCQKLLTDDLNFRSSSDAEFAGVCEVELEDVTDLPGYLETQIFPKKDA